MATTSSSSDGRWGWVLVACGFTVHLLTSGSHYGLAVLYVSWLDEFKLGKSSTSWIISIAVALKLFIGPIPAFLMERYGGGPVQLVGALLFSLGYVIASFSNSVPMLIMSIGVIGGIGCGFCYLPCLAVIAPYFNKRRGIAYGITTSGVGVGAFIFSPFLAYLEKQYAWRGSLLIVGGVMFHLCICGLLVWCAQRASGRGSTVVMYNSSVIKNDEAEVPRDNDCATGYCPLKRNADSQQTTKTSVLQCDESLTSTKLLPQSYETRDHSHPEREIKDGRLSNSYIELKLGIVESAQYSAVDHSSTTNSCILLSDSIGSLHFIDHLDNKDMHQRVKSSSASRKFSEQSKNSTNNISTKRIIRPRCLEPVHKFVSLLYDKVFVLLIISSFLANLSYFAPVLYMVDRAVEYDVPKTTAAMLLSVNGIANLIGRFSMGAMSDYITFDIIWLYIACLVVCGVSTALSSLCTINFLQHAVYSACFGLTMGSYTVLAPLVTAELMGVEKVANAYSILLFFMGLGNITGAPFAGWLFDISGDFFISYIVCGVAIMLSACFMLPVVCARHKVRRELLQVYEQDSINDSQSL